MLILNTLQIYVLYAYFCVCVKIAGYRNSNIAKLFQAKEKKKNEDRMSVEVWTI